MKFPTKNREIATIYVDQRAARECDAAGLKMKNSRTTSTEDSRNMVAMVDLDLKMNDGERLEPKEETTSIQLGEDQKQCVHIGGSLLEELVSRLIAILRRNKDLFAWKAANMSKINLDVISHKLSIY